MRKEFRVVLASPGDVEAERQAVAEVVTELNAATAPYLGYQIVLSRWETDTAPGVATSGPQELIDQALRIEEADVLLGIFWTRFGTPTGDMQSGTEHEIRRAYDLWKRTGRPRLMMYFSQKPYAAKSQAEIEQWGKVLKFKEDFPREGLYWTYTQPQKFGSLVRLHLTQVFLDRAGDVSPKKRALKGILESAAVDERSLGVVYSSTRVERFVDHRGRVIEYPYGDDELQVTTIPDARGTGLLHQLLALAGKRRNIDVITATGFRNSFWGRDLILLGSQNANPLSQEALKRHNVPFVFTERADGIVDLRAGNEARWPANEDDRTRCDYAILAKILSPSGQGVAVQFVLAGIGAVGTLAACHYLDTNCVDLFNTFGPDSFACVLKVPDKADPEAVFAVEAVNLSAPPSVDSQVATT